MKKIRSRALRAIGPHMAGTASWPAMPLSMPRIGSRSRVDLKPAMPQKCAGTRSTGTVGGQLVKQLAAKGAAFRVLTMSTCRLTSSAGDCFPPECPTGWRPTTSPCMPGSLPAARAKVDPTLEKLIGRRRTFDEFAREHAQAFK